MVRWTNIDSGIITTGWYAGPELILASSPPDGTPN
jgi:hypothetical protein